MWSGPKWSARRRASVEVIRTRALDESSTFVFLQPPDVRRMHQHVRTRLDELLERVRHRDRVRDGGQVPLPAFLDDELQRPGSRFAFVWW